MSKSAIWIFPLVVVGMIAAAYIGVSMCCGKIEQAMSIISPLPSLILTLDFEIH